MQPYQREFITYCLNHDVLQFGQFTLKSKRVSPYFFNMGKVSTGFALSRLTEFYSATIMAHFSASEYDLLFGPAYKGIALATCASIGLAAQGIDVSVCFNRKEAKDHGEGGALIGASFKHKRALLIDDVITAGTTVREAVKIAKQESGQLAGIVIALDRQERGITSPLSAVSEIEQTFDLRVSPIVTMYDLIDYLQETTALKHHLPAMLAYQTAYGT